MVQKSLQNFLNKKNEIIAQRRVINIMSNSKFVKYSKMYSPQNYVMAVTGKCYSFDSDDDCIQIEQYLKANGYDDLWSYALEDIDEIIENEANVVLVELCYFDTNDKLQYEYRWFEVPEDFKPDDEPNIPARPKRKKKNKECLVINI